MPFSDLPLLLKKYDLNLPSLKLIDGHFLIDEYYPAFTPEDHVFIFDVLPGDQAKKIQTLVMNVVLHDQNCVAFLLNEVLNEESQPKLLKISQIAGIESKFTLYLPPALADSSLESFQNLIAHLRSPQGCPWDREQTHQSLRSNLLEEAHEVLKALDEKDILGLREELGDLLLQIVLHAQISNETGEFNLSQVIQGIYEKIVSRHPHVFKDIKIGDAKSVIRKWEELKSIERHENGKSENQGILESIPISLPALSLAQEYQKRAARVGFDWSEIKPVLDKVQEELAELEDAPNQQRKEEELGDLLFAVVNLVRWYDVDAESALRKMSARFYKRFCFIEEKVRQQGKKMQQMSLEEMDAIWEVAKEEGL